MSTLMRDVFIVSDLHIGGALPVPTSANNAEKRGFRMMTHPGELANFIRRISELPAEPIVELVINGDFVDFLAEAHEGATRWLPFVYDPITARRVFKRIAVRDGDRLVFEALKALLDAGKRLTVLLGNHDIELSLPDVRSAFESVLGHSQGGRYRFLYDDEALTIGDALIEHGNLYDPANVVDHAGLRKLRALRSRSMTRFEQEVFRAPAGSYVVARVMNDIKNDYAFIDLLKPEAEPLFGLLLAIEPRYRAVLDELAAALVRIGKNLVPSRDETYFVRNVAAVTDPPLPASYLRGVAAAPAGPSPLRTVLADAGLPDAAIDDLLAASEPDGYAQGVASVVGAKAKVSLATLAASADWLGIDQRLTLVRATLSVLAGADSWRRDRENARYQRWAEFLAAAGPNRKGYRYIVFGHTHHAKDMPLPDVGAHYFNTGTWADLMRFPPNLLDPDDAKAGIALRTFAEDLAANKLDRYREFHPTYARLRVGDDGKIAHAALCDYDWNANKL
jgi:UDP-2,3-diacylglucosamine pyrophosphatase LpxH